MLSLLFGFKNVVVLALPLLVVLLLECHDDSSRLGSWSVTSPAESFPTSLVEWVQGAWGQRRTPSKRQLQ